VAKNRVSYIDMLSGITVILFGRPYNASADSGHYKEVVAMAEGGASEQEILDVFTRVERKVRDVHTLSPRMSYQAGVVYYDGQPLHNYAVDRLLTMIDAGREVKPLVAFLENLQRNPSKRVVDNLYRFLEHGQIPLTDDGHFLAYKAVRGDFKDIHSGTFDNSVGRVCEMARNRVDEDPNRTCSAGLHVCSFGYLPHFSHAGGHVMICKVNPADVVAIPADYNDTKMRVSRYEVVGEVLDYYGDARSDVLGEAGATVGTMGRDYRAMTTDGVLVAETYTLGEAIREAQDWAGESDEGVRIEDVEGYVVWECDRNGRSI
jgi:hypothetical protein